MPIPSYSTGTVSIGAGDTVIAGNGTIWSGVNARAGDDIVVAGHTVIIEDVIDPTHLAIDVWPYAAVPAGTAYKIVQRSPLRYAGGQAMADVSALVAVLNADGFYVFVPAIATVPDPSYGNDGQYAFQATTGKLWIKSGGAWTFVGVFKGWSEPKPWDSVTNWQPFDVVTLAGSSYFAIAPSVNQAPPNATYWQLIASKGDQGIQGATGTGYGGTSTTSLAIANSVTRVFTTQAGLAYNGARVRAASASAPTNFMERVCTYVGTTLTMTVDAIGGSGTKADWVFCIAGQPGTAGGGALIAANNLSDVASPSASRANLGLNQSVLIASGADLNTITAPGTYACTDNTCTNGPTVGVQWYIDVIIYPTQPYLMQRAVSLIGDGGVFTRVLLNNVWQPWVALILTGAQSLTSQQQYLVRANIAAQAQGDFVAISNGTISVSASAGALTVALKTFAGADPSTTEPVVFYFRNSALTAGDFTRIAVTSATSLVLGSTKTLGAVNAQGLHVYLGAFNDAGTVRLAAILWSDILSNYRPDEALKYTTAAPGNSVKTWYSTTAITTAAPWRWLARLRWASLSAAGTWTAPDIVELLGPKSMMPGDVVQRLNIDTQTATAITSNAFQNTSVTKDIALSSAANLVKINWNATLRTNNGAAGDVIAQLHRGGTAIGRSVWVDGPSGTTVADVGGSNFDFPNTTSTTTYMVKIKNDDNATTVSINPNGSAGSSMTLEEIMA